MYIYACFVMLIESCQDKMRKATMEKVSKSAVMKFVFETAFKIKKRLYLAGHSAPLLDKLIFSKTKDVLGGNMRLMLSGGAPLNADTQLFMNVVFSVPIGQGYGSTETCGAGTIST